MGNAKTSALNAVRDIDVCTSPGSTIKDDL